MEVVYNPTEPTLSVRFFAPVLGIGTHVFYLRNFNENLQYLDTVKIRTIILPLTIIQFSRTFKENPHV